MADTPRITPRQRRCAAPSVNPEVDGSCRPGRSGCGVARLPLNWPAITGAEVSCCSNLEVPLPMIMQTQDGWTRPQGIRCSGNISHPVAVNITCAIAGLPCFRCGSSSRRQLRRSGPRRFGCIAFLRLPHLCIESPSCPEVALLLRHDSCEPARGHVLARVHTCELDVDSSPQRRWHDALVPRTAEHYLRDWSSSSSLDSAAPAAAAAAATGYRG